MKSAETKRRTIKKHKSTTKAVMFIMMALTVIVVFFAMVLAWVIKEASIIVTLLPCIFVETATCTGFYFWKRKVEDMIKLKQEYGEQFIENTLDDV